MSREDVQNRIRRRRRNSGGGLSSGFSSNQEGEPQDLNDHVMETAAPETDAVRGHQEPPPEIEQPFTPSGRMKEVAKRSSTYEREYRLRLLNRMLMRNVPIDEIAKEIGVSVGTVLKDRRELHKRLREAAKRIDIHEFIGRGMSFYEEARGIALRASSSTKAPLNVRLAAVRTALSANNDGVRFLDAVGVFDVLKYSAAESSGSSDMEKLVALTEQFLADDKEEQKDKSGGKDSSLSIAQDLIENGDDFPII